MNSQNKNTIKQALLLIASILIAEGVAGIGLFWPFLLRLGGRKSVYWISFVSGLVLSSMYSQKIGLMSLFIILVVFILEFFIGSRGHMKVILLISIFANFIFDNVFGLHWNLWESGLIVVVCTLLGKELESSETIKIHFK